MARERNEKGQFIKGRTPEGAVPISEGIAKEYQERSVKARRENRTLRETLWAAINEPGGGGLSKMEILVRQAMENHRKGKLTFRDLKDLASVLGEDKMQVDLTLTDTEAPIIVFGKPAEEEEKQ